MKTLLFGISFAVIALAPATLAAQCGNLAESCSSELIDYLDDGQYFGAEVVEGELVEVNLTFFAGYTYRIVACTPDESNAQVDYVMTDGRNRQIFSNEKLPDGKGWDFVAKATDTYTISARISGESKACVVFEVGYKEIEDAEEDDEILEASTKSFDDSDLEVWKGIDKDFNLDDLDNIEID